jgi:protein-L-isoaspartate O-methyltransferase
MVSFETTSELYPLTHATGTPSTVLQTGKIDTGDGDCYVLRVNEMKAIKEYLEEGKNEPEYISLEPEILSPVMETLAFCNVSGLQVSLPEWQLSKKIYSDVKKTLEKIGGKWNTKAQGFVFEHDPLPLIQRVILGENVNLKKDFQFFATPSGLVEKMILLADLKKTDVVLEPSAGRGAIVEQLIPLVAKVEMCEFMKQNRDYLERERGYEVAWGDFLALNINWKYDKIIANPPFTKNQDITHVMKMYEHLKSGGKLVAIMSQSWLTGSQKKQVEFREFLESLGASIEKIDSGEFKESGTSVATTLVVIDKP